MSTTTPSNSSKKPFPWHVFLIALYPILALLATNIGEVRISAAVRALLVSAIAAGILFGLDMLLLRNLHKAGLITSWIFLLFFSYGHIYNALEDVTLFGLRVVRHRYFAPLFVVILVIGVWLILRKLKTTGRVTLLINLAALLLLIIPTIQVTYNAIRQANSTRSRQVQQAESILQMPDLEEAPDIYYIVLDAYTREDALREMYGFDNAPFIQQLEEMGFYVADCSRSNYSTTLGCFSSTLNMAYLDDLLPEIDPQKTDTFDLKHLTYNSLVWEELGKIGYTRVAFDSGFIWSSFGDADTYLVPPKEEGVIQRANPFEVMLIRSTAGVMVLEASSVLKATQDAGESFDYGEHIARERFKLDNLAEVSKLPGPKLVFAHIIIPHPPFIFRANGEVETDTRFYSNGDFPINQELFVQGYTQQISFINSRIVPILQIILAESERPPVIILQGDHGMQEDRMLILNAYYLPKGEEQLYPGITPVNSFRVVFNTYFGTDYPLLEDISYMANYEAPFHFWIIEEENPACLTP